MDFQSYWNRRRFLSHAAAAATLASHKTLLSLQQHRSHPQSAATSPEEIAGKTRGLMISKTARPLRYHPQDDGFVIRNGREFFNRPLYGVNNAFRIDAGDLPEFSLYLPGHGGNLRLGFSTETTAKWLFEASDIVAKYRRGRLFYEVRDPLLGESPILLELCTMSEEEGLQVCIQSQGISLGTRLIWMFGGASGRRGKRGGDIGCESEPVSQFFQVRPEECRENHYILENHQAILTSKITNLLLTFPEHSDLFIGDGEHWNDGWKILSRSRTATAAEPVLLGAVELNPSKPQYVEILRMAGAPSFSRENDVAESFSKRSKQLDTLASRISITTPDPFIDAVGGALCFAGDAIWDERQQCVMHGAVAWRSALAGWRGPYVLDCLGWHDRFQEHARHWIAKQNTSPVTTSTPAMGKPDPGSHLTRSENLLHSQGDLSHNHYDMNLVFFDALLRHLQWTGDKEFAREIWPALLMHLEWERRLFRRVYREADGRELPLYEGYACIWASDNLQYNGGGAAHSTAYNYYANSLAAKIARWIGQDATFFDKESALILDGMRSLLWLQEQGTFGESKDILTTQRVYTSPALWSVYHTIDSEVATPQQAWQMATEVLNRLKKVPIDGPDVPQGDLYMLPCSDWMPYLWSLNLLLLAENMHMALALWQAGMAEEAFRIFKGNIVDSMFQGLCPGNFHMTSALDDHRQEAQRDFGDPIGITSRALIEGLFGIKPDLIHDTVTISPGFPKEWNNASLHHCDVDLKWQRVGTREVLEITSHFGRPVQLLLKLRSLWSGKPVVMINHHPIHDAKFDSEAVGDPLFIVPAGAAEHWIVEVEWTGKKTPSSIPFRSYALGEKIVFPGGTKHAMEDPQSCIKGGRVISPGIHTIFIPMEDKECRWRMPVSFEVKASISGDQPQKKPREVKVEPLDLTAHLKHSVTDIFRRSYSAPRSSYCSLSIPEQGAGAWAAFDLQPAIDDTGLRGAGGILTTPDGVSFYTPSDPTIPNCLFLSQWQQDQSSVEVPLTGQANGLFLLLAASTFPQCSHMQHGLVTIRYTDGSVSLLELRTPETLWPIEQDFLLDDYLFVSNAPIPPRVDLRSGKVRILDPVSFKGKGKSVPGGAACVLKLELDPDKQLSSMRIEADLYGPVLCLLGATLIRSN